MTVKFPLIGLGLWQLGSPSWGTRGLASAVDLIGAALEAGFTLFDTAEVYGWGEGERLLGAALKELRVGSEAIIATKVAGFRSTPYFILKAARVSNRRLDRTPDVIQYHWPPPFHTPLCVAMRGLERLIDEGLTNSVGLSNFDSSLLEEALECFHRHEPVSIQVEYNLAYRAAENKLIPLARGKRLAVIAWSPLAKGALAGAREAVARAQRGDKVFKAAAGDLRLQGALKSIAERRKATPAQVALAWLISKESIPIPGTRSVERVREYAAAARLNLSEEEVGLLDDASAAYLSMWGSDYGQLRYLRIIPSPIQYLAARVMGGV